MPAWLLEKWGQQFGTEVAATIARAALHPPETYIRIPLGSAVPESVSLKETDVPGCYRVIKGDTSDFRVQDIGSQSVVRLLEAGPGQTFLDLCAAPGNKTLQALESGVFAVACDISSTRMRALDGSGAHQVILDGTQPLPFRRAFDRILVDAPCSGTGTLGRNPEIKWRVQRLDLTRHRARQVKLLKNALDQLARGGRLVYSTCSLEDEENGKVVKEVVAESRPEIHLDHTALRIPGIAPGDGFFAAVITSE
jgi:16S rRNA (cytosine967-C5)-methyltransferase